MNIVRYRQRPGKLDGKDPKSPPRLLLAGSFVIAC